MPATVKEMFDRRELLVNLTLRDLRGRFRRSILGWAWTLITPLATMAIYTVVFRYLLKVHITPGDPSGLHGFIFFLICGLLFWNFFSMSLTNAMSTLIGNAALIQRVYFPRQLLVVASVGTNLITAAIGYGVLILVLLAMGYFVLPWVVVFMAVLLLMTAFTTGLSLFLSAANVYFRDLEYVVTILLQLIFYSAPVVYPSSLIPVSIHVAGAAVPARFIYGLNPLAQFVRVSRFLLYDMRMPPLHGLIYLVCWSVAALWAGNWAFKHMERRMPEEL
ncbi:MAG: ABC transporter permease [Actinobacteria bacterium]|jgi:ABC-2 type transport system permease protein|nr:ABC transporter permease [Actinomycetota bacterium]